MAVESRVGNILTPIVTGNQPVTGLPFQPKLVLFFSTSLTGTTDTDVYLDTFGAAASSSQQFVISQAENGAAAANAGRIGRTGACIGLPLNGNYAADALATFVSMNSDGFTINWTDASATANIQVHYLALGGTDLTNVFVGAHTIVRTTAGTEATTGVGFTPDALLFASPGVPNSTSIVDATMCFGSATRTLAQQGALAFFENDAAANMDTFQRRSLAKCLVLPDATSILEAEAAMSSWDADGFTLNWTDPVAAASSRVFYYIAMKGGQYATNATATPTVTGNDAVTVGFQPKAVFFSSLQRTLAVDTSTTAAGDAGINYGAVDSALNQRAVGINETDANGVSQSWRGNSITKCVRLLKGLRSAKATRAEAQADAGAMTSTGFQLNWTTVDAAAYQYHWLAIGDNPPPPVPPVFPLTARTRT